VERGGFVESIFIVGFRLYRFPTISVKSAIESQPPLFGLHVTLVIRRRRGANGKTCKLPRFHIMP